MGQNTLASSWGLISPGGTYGGRLGAPFMEDNDREYL